MPTCKLTLSTVQKAKCPPGKTQEFYRDTQLTGFVLVVTAGGKRRFAYQYRPPEGGSHRQIPIGNYPPLHLEEARLIAIGLAHKVLQGTDPQEEKAAKKREAEARQVARANLVFERQWPAYLNYLSKTHPNGPRSEPYVANVRSFGERYLLPHFNGTRLDEINRELVRELLDNVDEEKVSVPKNLFVCLRSFLNWAEAEGIIDRNPISKMRGPAGVEARERALKDNEIQAFWAATETLSKPQQACCRMLLLTGGRLSTISEEFLWDRLDRENAQAIIPRKKTKNKKLSFAIYLSRQSIEILDEIAGGSIWPSSGPVFTNDGFKPLNGFSKLKKKLDAAFITPIEPWRLHDLRRTFATNAQQCGIPIHITERCLNHLSGTFSGIVSNYQVFEYEPERRVAYQAVADRIYSLVEKQP
ncbi:MAG: hypothetical protein RL764_397 [Pseudomonadota bacterium]|jgi:integrase